MNPENPANSDIDPNSRPLLIRHLDNQGVLTLTLNRPDSFNSLSEAMLDALQSELNTIDDSVRVLVLAASGKAFCAGHDLKEMRAHIDEQWQRALFKKCSAFMQTLIDLPPTTNDGVPITLVHVIFRQ